MSLLNKFVKNNINLFKSSLIHFTRSCTTSIKNYDIIIVGGGMIGLTLGYSLAQNSWISNKKILILELGPKPDYKVNTTYSNRVVSLNEQSKSLLESLGVWNKIEKTRFKTVRKMIVWESYSDALIEFIKENMSDPISYIVENNLLLASLNEKIENLNGGLDIEYNTKIKDVYFPLNPSKGKPQILKEDGTSYTCDLLIGADGFQSKVREAMGIKHLSWDYNQRGIVATLKLSEPTENIVAWQRFLPTGPIALLPLNDELSSLVWSANEDLVKQLLALPDDEFVDAVNDAFWKPSQKSIVVEKFSEVSSKILGENVSGAVRQLPPSIINIQPGSRAAFPLGLGHASRYIQPNTILVGDAAHRIHPLAGQGVNLGFGDIKALTKHLAEGISRGERIEDLSTLAQYETERQRQNISFIIATHGLQLLYSSTWMPLVVLRSLGVNFINSLDPIKKAIMKHAS